MTTPSPAPAPAGGSRRAATRTNPGRIVMFWLVVVGLTVGMLTLAGTTPRGIGRPVEDPSRVQLDRRTFSCAGGIEGASTRSGSVKEGLAAAKTVPVDPRQPVTFVAGRDVATGAFAGQQASTATSLAWLPCPEPRARWWFVGAGGAAVTHDTVLTLSNPRAGEASVDIEVFGPDGPVEAPDFSDVQVPAGGHKVIDLAKTAPAVGELAVKIIARRGLVAVSAVDRFSPGAVGDTATEWLPAQSSPGRSTTIAGIPPERGASTLVVVNPGPVEAIVKVSVIGATGTFTPEALSEFIVGPESVQTLPMASVIDGTPLALRITSAQRVTATLRSVKAGDTSYATGVRLIRGSTAFAVPDGKGQLVLSSLRQGSTVQVTAHGSGGETLLDDAVKVAARTSVPVALPAGTRYVSLEADRVDAVAGFSVLGKAGVTGAGVMPSRRSVLLPQVSLGW
ncbi:hypothetical protein ABIE44_002940 [Marmoricola sp. OAE513]|uniref:DUF5719 family protein n=1 Tax=Marmoricola sp. OAE513 TaxID=2817894 RepID=UPI001AE6135E